MRNTRNNTKPPIIANIPKISNSEFAAINEIPAIRPIIPMMIPIARVIPAKAFAVCSAPKSLLDSNEGEMFLSIDISFWSLNAEDGHPQLGHDTGIEFPSKTFPQSGQ